MTKTFSIPLLVSRDDRDARLVVLTDANGSTVTHQLPNSDCATIIYSAFLHNLAKGGNHE